MLDTILTDKTLKSESQEDNTLISSKGQIKNENENDNTLMSSKDENKNENENENDNENENENNKMLMSSKDKNDNEDDDETMSQNKKIKDLNNLLDGIIDKSKSFEDQIESLEKVYNLDEYYFSNDFHDKKLIFKKFKLKLADM